LIACESTDSTEAITYQEKTTITELPTPTLEELILSGLQVPYEKYTYLYHDGTGNSFPYIGTSYNGVKIFFAYGEGLGFGRSHIEDLTIVVNPKAIQEECNVIETLLKRELSYEKITLAVAKQELWHIQNHAKYGYSEEAELLGEIISLQESSDYATMRIFTLMREMNADQNYPSLYHKLIDAYRKSIEKADCSYFLTEESPRVFNIENATENLQCIDKNISYIIQNYVDIAELSKK
jgi:hypothetical protein